jgi:2-dehydropantoate 2-reductase
VTDDAPAAPAAHRPTVAVVGVGAIGAFFAAPLIEAGVADVTLCVRTPFTDLVVESQRWSTTTRSQPRVCTDPAQLGPDGATPADWVLLATKAHQTAGAAGWLRALTGPDTTVVVLQNGVEHVDRVRPLLPDPSTAIVPAVVYSGVELVAPGHAVHRSNGFCLVPAAWAAPLAALYPTGSSFVRPSDDFVSAMWQKLCANVVANGITALTGQRMEVMRRPDAAALGRALLAECTAVGRAEGAAIPDDYPDVLLEGVAAMPEGSGTSMLYDRLAHRPMEQDAKYGAVVRAGRRHGIATPVHDTFLALLSAISDAEPASMV